MTLGGGVVSGHGLGSGKWEMGNGERQEKRLTARVSHNPPAILASKSAEHGATTTRSVQRRNYAIEERKKTLLDTLNPPNPAHGFMSLLQYGGSDHRLSSSPTSII